MTSLTSFPIFSNLPVELRDKIWGIAANQEPRTLDIWTDFHRCQQSATTFYAQKYECFLANKMPPALLRACTESRDEALRHYTLEYKTIFPVATGVTHSFPARFYVNYASDTLVPCGFWNSVAFWDFIRRGWGRLSHLAIDVTGSFWKDNLMENMIIKEWVFEGIQDLILYDATDLEIFNRGRTAQEFLKRYRGGPRDLSFTTLPDGKMGKLLEDADVLMELYLKNMSGIESPEESGKDITMDDVAELSHKKSLEKLNDTDNANDDGPQDVQRMNVRIMELVANIPSTC